MNQTGLGFLTFKKTIVSIMIIKLLYLGLKSAMLRISTIPDFGAEISLAS